MARTVNQYFNVLGSRSKQRQTEDLIIEVIRKQGQQVFYVPRTLVKLDSIFGEDPMSSFLAAYPIEMYFDDPSAGYQGGGDPYLISKFMLEIRDTANFICSRRRFNQVILYDGTSAMPQTDRNAALSQWNAQHNIQTTSTEVRPMDGDLIYLPLTNDIFQIKKADHESVFYQLGARYIWRISVQKFDYSNETIQTGVPQIDRIQQKWENADNLVNDPIADNTNIKTDATTILDWSEENPFGEPDHN